MIDWTVVTTTRLGNTGKAEYKVENDGLVRWRGLITLTSAAAFTNYIAFPEEAKPLPSVYALYIDFESGSRGILCNGTEVYFGTAGGLVDGTVINLDGFVYMGTPPPPNPHSLAGVQAGLTSALRNIVGLRVYDFPSDRVETPAAVLSLPETPFDVTMGGRADELTFPLWVLVAKADDKAAYKEMVGYLEPEGAKSIRAVVEADRTLGGACDTAAVIRARPLFATVAGTEFLAVEFTLEVYT